MPTEGELRYYEAIGDAGVHHAINKPYSNPDCDLVLMQIGAVLALLPPPPARVLECGCGSGWLSRIFAARGYPCTGIDVSDQAIALANAQPPPPGSSLRFFTQDAETMTFREEFDAVVFFDSLHHSLDEGKVLEAVFRALRPGGVCITSEPGRGHAERSREVVEHYGVTEKDMPASHIIRLGLAAGFRSAETFPRMDDLGRFLYKKPVARHWWQRLVRRVWLLNLLNGVRAILATRRRLDDGLVVLHKGEAAPRV